MVKFKELQTYEFAHFCVFTSRGSYLAVLILIN